MKHTYQDKIVIVTGGTSGIGQELVRQLGALGARVYFCGRSVGPGEQLAHQLSVAGQVSQFVSVDVSDNASVQNFINSVVDTEGRIDYLFHCAGIILGGEYRDHQIEEIQRVLDTNVTGTAHIDHAVYTVMAAQGRGHIINIGSAAGLFPVPLMGLYSASKFFVYGISEVLRMEGRGLGVRVSVAAPGIVDTPIYDSGMYSQVDKERTKRLVKKRLWTIQADVAASRILRGAAANQGVIFTQWYGRMGWWSYRFVPPIFRTLMARGLRPYRKRLRNTDQD